MRLSKKDLKALRAAALSLASDICEGRGPEFRPWIWCGCAAGEIVVAANLAARNTDHQTEIACHVGIDFDVPLSVATMEEFRHHDGSLVFPLLWLADELEYAAQPPSKDSAVLEEL